MIEEIDLTEEILEEEEIMDLSSYSGDWYILHTYSGQEDRVKKNLDQRVKTMDLKDKIFGCVVPTESEVEVKDGQRKIIKKKMYAGYLLVNMTMDDDSWFAVRNTPGITGFISSMKSDSPKVRVGFAKGDSVRIKDGPFAEFMGTVDYVDQDKGKARVLVSFFGRDTPVELDFLQLDKG